MPSASWRKEKFEAAARNPLSPGNLALGALCLAAFISLALGTSVYVLDRAPGAIRLLPMHWTGVASGTSGFFGSVGDSLPSFAHAFAFSILSGLWLELQGRLLACASWATAGSAFEFGQHEAVAPALAALLHGPLDWLPGAAAVAAYFSRGTYDALDVLLTCAGAVTAAIALTAASRAYSSATR